MSSRATLPTAAIAVLCLSSGAAFSQDAPPRSTPASTQDSPTRAAPEWTGQVHEAELVDPSRYGNSYIEHMDDVVARDLARREMQNPDRVVHGEWVVPSRRGTFYPHSGEHYITNKYGDTRMGLAFPQPVDLHGAYVAGQAASGVWTKGLRVIGYRQGEEIARTDWFTDVDEHPDFLAINFNGVDRVVFESRAVVNGGGWYALDDIAFTPQGQAKRIVLDFEDTKYRQKMTGSDYAGLTWETGTGEFEVQDDAVQAPSVPPGVRHEIVDDQDAGGGVAGGGSATTPILELDFQGVLRGDAGSASFPPDTIGAIGPNHYVETVNRNFAIYDRDTGAELVSVHLQSFLPNSNGDPRVVYDQFDDRWIVIVSDFNASLFLAVSTTSDPTGDWFKTDWQVSVGPDAGCFPDYETLGVDEHGIYTTSYMVGCGMSVFALDKAPLIDANPSLGTITAFRGLPFEGAIQPMVTFGDSGGMYFISANGGPLVLRQLQGDITSPSLVDLGNVTVPGYSGPPNVPALGSTTALDHTIGVRVMNAVYRNGFVWASHDVSANGRSAVRWYQIDPQTLSTAQVGTVADASLHYFYGGIAVNANNDVVIGFSGADASQYAGCYYTGRRGSDPLNAMAIPVQYKEGTGPQNNIDGFGRNRWGDYSITSVDPVDDATFWTIQEYGHAVNIWGTWIAKLRLEEPLLTFSYPDGRPETILPSGDSFRVAFAVADGEQLDADSPTLFYAEGDGFQSAPMVEVSPGVYDAVFPPTTCEAVVSYYVAADVESGASFVDPAGAPANVFTTFSVFDIVVPYEDTLESDTGWAVGGPNDDATTGEWVRADPNGTAAQPENDHTPEGTQCFFTGQGSPGGGVGENDVDGGQTTLTTPTIDLSGTTGAMLSYWRWYSNTAGATPNTDIFIIDISNNDGASWTTLEVVGPTGPHTSGGWFLNEFVVSDVIEPTDQMRLRFIASDEGDGSIVEAAIDDVRVSFIVCDDAADPDLDGDGSVGAADLAILLGSWGPCPGCPADLDGDGVVGAADLAILLGSWG